jgi:death-on-curing protein
MARIYPTVAETIETHRLLIEEFGGHHGIRDRGLLESAVFRPRTGYYRDIIEEAAALMESLANNHAFIDGNKRIAFAMVDVMLAVNGYVLEVEPLEAHTFITEAMEKNQFRFALIHDWLAPRVKLDLEGLAKPKKK